MNRFIICREKIVCAGKQENSWSGEKAVRLQTCVHVHLLSNCSNIANTAQCFFFFHFNVIIFIMKTEKHHVHIDAFPYSG